MKKTQTIKLALLGAAFVATHAMGQNAYAVTAKVESSNSEVDNRSIFSKKFPNKHILDWSRGMRFIVSGHDKNSIIEERVDLAPLGTKRAYFDRLKVKDFEWKIFELDTVEEREVDCPKGKCTRVYAVLTHEGKKFEHEVGLGSKAEVRNGMSQRGLTIGGLLYLNDIDLAKQELEGKTIWVMTDEWRRDGEAFLETQKSALKFVSVKVLRVGAGTEKGPVRIVFKANEAAEAYIDVCISNVNIQQQSVGLFSHEFDDCFSIENPRIKYSKIPQSHWDAIQKGKVVIGMSKSAAELSWGKPKEINNDTYNGGKREQWVYYSSYLYFTNGKLSHIQN